LASGKNTKTPPDVPAGTSLELPWAPACVSIVVAGPPVPKGRPRLSTFNGHARAFTPTKTRRYEDLIRLEAARVMDGKPQLDGALKVGIRAFMPMPQALAKHKTKGPSAEAGVIRPLTKPDVDNFAKVIDALNGIVWRDDNQVVALTVEKFYSARPRLELTAVEL
jgi:Holliday junction resolvase RusA-like endonuclease